MDVSGWQLADGAGTWTIPAGSVLPASGRLTLARDAAGFSALFGSSPDVAGMTLSLNNGGDQLLVRDTVGATIDFMAWEGFAAGRSLTAATGDSMVRADPTTDGDTAGDWQVRSSASPDSAGGTEPPPPPPSGCGDGVCGGGEDCVSCPADCIGKTGGKPSGSYCCGNGVCESVGETAATCTADCG